MMIDRIPRKKHHLHHGNCCHLVDNYRIYEGDVMWMTLEEWIEVEDCEGGCKVVDVVDEAFDLVAGSVIDEAFDEAFELVEDC